MSTPQPFDKLSQRAQDLVGILALRYSRGGETSISADEICGFKHFGGRREVLRLFAELVSRDFGRLRGPGHNPSFRVDDTKIQSFLDDDLQTEGFLPPPSDIDDNDEWYGGGNFDFSRAAVNVDATEDDVVRAYQYTREYADATGLESVSTVRAGDELQFIPTEQPVNDSDWAGNETHAIEIWYRFRAYLDNNG